LSLYDRAQLDGDNSELDALKRLASSHDNSAALVGNSTETLPFSSQHSTSSLTMENTLPTTAVSTLTGYKVKVEPPPASEHPAFAKRAKLLLIPDSITAHHSLTTQNHSRLAQSDARIGVKCEQPCTGFAITGGSAKRKNVSDSGQKSVPLGDVMNVKLTGGRVAARGAVSLVPLSSVASASSSHPPPVNRDWNQHVKIKLEPGLPCQRAGKRKLPVEHGMF